MRKFYPYLQDPSLQDIYFDNPYLQDPYNRDLNVESKKRQFLSYIDSFINQRQYIKMTLLDWEENPIKAIEGEISSGNIAKDGNSTIRRTCNLTCVVNGNSYNVDNMDMDFTLNRKIFIELGVKNDSPYYPEYPILWFPQGIFFITSFSMNSSASSTVNLSIGLKDKMAMLNGDVGGMLPGTVRFDAMDTQLKTGEWKEQKVLIYNIIYELVNHYGGEDLNNIVIEDVPLRIRKIMKWNNNDVPLYGICTGGGIGQEQWEFKLTQPTSGKFYTYKYGADVGYIYSDFVLSDELYGNSGDSVCTILDKIKTILGNYEYFYDEMGIFHFREIKNFLNVTQAEFVLDSMSENDYLIETTNEKALYSFEDSKNITSISITPNYSNIKNEYIVHGLMPGTAEDPAMKIMYHLVIDEKPQLNDAGFYGGQYVQQMNNNNATYVWKGYTNLALYTDPLDKLNKLTKYKTVETLPLIGNFNLFYKLNNDNNLYYWDNNMYKIAVLEDSEGNEQEPEFYTDNNPYYPKDWRTFLYIKGLEAQENGTDEGIYFQELAAFWPAEYNLKNDQQGFFGAQVGTQEKYLTLTEGKYFLDFIDTSSELGKYSVSAIGRRGDVVTDDKINCLFEPEIPDVVFLSIDHPENNVSENTVINDDTGQNITLADARAEVINNGHSYTQVHDDIYNALTIGGYKNSAYEKIKYELFYHTNYQKTISLTSLPVFYLEPNSRVTISDKSTNTYGDFMVQSINITFGPGANMSVTLNEIFEKL